jgi:hydrogenase nickel incorporation protein HypB
MVQNALNGSDLQSLDFVLIEDVGSLVYPSSYDFGEDPRFVPLTVTAGEDQPVKYLTIVDSADATTITESDLADVVECDGPPLDEISKPCGRAWKSSDRRPKQGNKRNTWNFLEIGALGPGLPPRSKNK